MIRALPLAMFLLPAMAMAQVTTGIPPQVQAVTIPAGDVALEAQLALPPGAPKGPSVVALHGCGGPWKLRDAEWQRLLTEAGHVALFPDSFGSRGLGSQCKNADRTIRPGRERRADTVAAVGWLAAQPSTPPGGIVVMGWSNGGSTVLAAAGTMPEGTVRGFIALYPGCGPYARRTDWAPVAPLLILMGESDDWTPAAPCHALAQRFPDRITLVTYPDTFHDFDVPGRKLRARTGLAYTAGGNGVAHTGTNPAAREDAILRVLKFLSPP